MMHYTRLDDQTEARVSWPTGGVHGYQGHGDAGDLTTCSLFEMLQIDHFAKEGLR